MAPGAEAAQAHGAAQETLVAFQARRRHAPQAAAAAARLVHCLACPSASYHPGVGLPAAHTQAALDHAPPLGYFAKDANSAGFGSPVGAHSALVVLEVVLEVE